MSEFPALQILQYEGELAEYKGEMAETSEYEEGRYVIKEEVEKEIERGKE